MEITGYKEKSSHVRNGITSTVYLMDCIQGLKQLPHMPNCLAVVDPPYGQNSDYQVGRHSFVKNGKALAKRKYYENKGWDKNPPNEKYFKELKRVAKNQVIWGANNFSNKFNSESSGWLVWNKVTGTSNFGDCELAYSSFDNAIRMFTYQWHGMLQQNMKNKEERIHPTQKPVALYDWIFANYATVGDLILDTHLGSGSSRIAAWKSGLNFIGFEVDEDYFQDQEKRFKTFISQQIINFE
jgi:site-specific DNA-methyltransferase (adenine-specific)